MKKILAVSIVVLTGVLFATYSFAHHAMEYIEMDSYPTARQGEFVLYLQYDYMVEEKNNPDLDHWEFTPGLSYGITDRLMADLHTHFAKFGNEHLIEEERAKYDPHGPPAFMEAAAFALQYRLTENLPVDIAIAGLYELPFQRSKDLLDGQEVLEGVLILYREIGEHSNVCMNLKYGKDGDKTVKE